jgi:cytoskeletal protein RodZ
MENETQNNTPMEQEGFTDKIHQLISRGTKSNEQTRTMVRAGTFSITFMSFVLVLMIVVLGLFGVLFIQFSQITTESMTNMQRQISIMQERLKAVAPDPAVITPPPASRSSTTSQ